MTRWLAFGAIMLATAACDHPPTQPTTVAPETKPTLLTITPATSLLKVGASETFSAFAVFPDGSGESVAAQWSVDRSAVATVQSTGVLTAAGAGMATITAIYRERSASRSLRVIPDYAATWEGTVIVLECLDGDPGICTSAPCCPAFYVPGRTFTIAAILAHRDEHVTGFITNETAGPAAVPSTGTIDLDGTLTLEGILRSSDSLGTVETRIDWKTTIDPTGVMRGTFVETRPSFSNNRTTPPARIRYQIESLRRTG
jgi:Bacterial Ig-like domain (group 2)